MGIKKTLNGLLNYYGVNRNAGHTETMLKGAENTDCLVVWANHHTADQFKDRVPLDKSFILWNSTRLRGNNRPLAIDNSAMVEILSGSLREIERLEESVKREREHKEAWMEISRKQSDDNAMAVGELVSIIDNLEKKKGLLWKVIDKIKRIKK